MAQLWEGVPPPPSSPATSGVGVESSWDRRPSGASLSCGLLVASCLVPDSLFLEILMSEGGRDGSTLTAEFTLSHFVLQSTCHTWPRTKGLEVTWSNSTPP